MGSTKNRNGGMELDTVGWRNPGFDGGSVDEDDMDLKPVQRFQKSQKKWVGTMALISLIPVLILMGICLWKLSEAVQVRQDAKDGKDSVKDFLRLDNLIALLQREKSSGANFVRLEGKEDTFGWATTRRNITQQAVKDAPWPEDKFPDAINTKQKFQRVLDELRESIARLELTVSEELLAYEDLIWEVLTGMEQVIFIPDKGEAWKIIIADSYLLRAATSASTAGSMARNIVYACGFTTEEHTRYLRMDGRRQEMLEKAILWHQPLQGKYNIRILNRPNVGDTTEEAREWLRNTLAYYQSKCQAFSEEERRAQGFQTFWSYYLGLLDLHADLQVQLDNTFNNIVLQAENDVIIYIIVILAVIVLSVLVIVLLANKTYGMTSYLLVYTKRTTSTIHKLQREKSKTNTLMAEMLPATLATELIAGRTVHPQMHYNATLCYIDLVGYFALVSQLKPPQVVRLLNSLYKLFDHLAESHGVYVYKVEQHNDVYCAVSGLPEPNAQHASEIANFTLEIIDKVHDFTDEALPGVRMKVRIGIHTGPMASGVVGHKIPRFSVFGETVKMAERMSRTSEVDRIQISRETRNELVKYKRYQITERGQVQLYGLGDVTTYFLDGF